MNQYVFSYTYIYIYILHFTFQTNFMLKYIFSSFKLNLKARERTFFEKYICIEYAFIIRFVWLSDSQEITKKIV